MKKQEVYTFTVPLHDVETIAMVEKIKKRCRATGQTFTFVCLQALRQHEEANNQLDAIIEADKDSANERNKT